MDAIEGSDEGRLARYDNAREESRLVVHHVQSTSTSEYESSFGD